MKTPTMYMLEMEHGQDIRDILTNAVESRGSIRSAARSLGITHSTLLLWLKRLNLTVTITLKQRL